MTHQYFLTLVLALFIGSMGCDPEETETFCGGLDATTPSTEDISSGLVSWVEDGAQNSESGTWSGGSNGDITYGTISMIIAKDDTGATTEDLITAANFPICIPLGERSETSGNATDTGAFVTDANNTGNIAILGQEGDDIVGRFEFEMGNANGEVRALTQGMFRIPKR